MTIASSSAKAAQKRATSTTFATARASIWSERTAPKLVASPDQLFGLQHAPAQG